MFAFKEIWKEIFKSGTHTDAGGNTREWTEKDLDEMVQFYNNQSAEAKHDAPVVVGHPADNSPAYGWVESLKRSGNTLLAKFRDVDENFKELVNAGRYGKISIALYPNKLLRHVGFLGAIPPAVKGLKAPSFNDKEQSITHYEIEKIIINYSETNMPEHLKNLFNELLNSISTKYNAELANQIRVDIDELVKKHKITDKPQAPAPSQDENSNPDFKESPEYKALQDQFNKLESDNRAMKFNEIFQDLLRAGKATPAQKDSLKVVYDLYLESGKKFEYSEGDKKVELTGESAFKKYVATLPKVVEFNEFAINNPDNGKNTFAEDDKTIEEFNKSRGL